MTHETQNPKTFTITSFEMLYVIVNLFLISGVCFAGLPWAKVLLLGSSLMSCLGTIYLATVLFCVLKEICIACVATYLVNFTLMYLNYQYYFMHT